MVPRRARPVRGRAVFRDAARRVFRPFQLLRRNVNRFRGGLVFKAHRLVYHSTLDLRVIKKKKKVRGRAVFRDAAPPFFPTVSRGQDRL